MASFLVDSSWFRLDLFRLSCMALLAVSVYTLFVLNHRRKKPAYEKIGVSYDHNGELLWICRSSEAKQVFTVRADTMGRAERRRTWSAGMDDEVSKHLRSCSQR